MMCIEIMEMVNHCASTMAPAVRSTCGAFPDEKTELEILALTSVKR